MAVGFVLFILPTLSGDYPNSLLKLVSRSVEGLSLDQLVLLFLGGLFFGFVFERPYAFWSSVSMLGSLPIFAVIEMVKDPTSHNLWPFEFIIYALLTLVPLAGFGLAVTIKKHFGEGVRQTPPG